MWFTYTVENLYNNCTELDIIHNQLQRKLTLAHLLVVHLEPVILMAAELDLSILTGKY